MNEVVNLPEIYLHTSSNQMKLLIIIMPLG